MMKLAYEIASPKNRLNFPDNGGAVVKLSLNKLSDQPEILSKRFVY